MAVTSHGHHIPDSGNEEEDEKVPGDRCGGIHHCKVCASEAQAYTIEKIGPAQSSHYEEQIDWDIDANQPAKSYPAEIIEEESDLEKALGHLLNRFSAENESGTPDFILAMYLKAQLDLFNQTIKNRAVWRGEHTELPALYDLEHGKKEVPLVTYKDGHRNEIGTATVQVTPGEVLVEDKIITSVEAMFADPGEAYSIDLDEPKDEPRPTTRFERYQKEGFNPE